MDSYAVSTSLTLDDKLIAGLKRVAAELRSIGANVDRLKKAVASGFSVRATGADRLRADLLGASRAAGTLRTGLASVRLNPSAASGASISPQASRLRRLALRR
jgi:hypothetical protein